MEVKEKSFAGEPKRMFRNGCSENFHFVLLRSESIWRRMIGLDRDDYKQKNCTQNWQMRRGVAGLLLIGSGFDAALGLYFILNELGFFNV